MTTAARKAPEALEVTVTVSAPYREIGYHGGRYGAGQFMKRDYTATVLGADIKVTSKDQVRRLARVQAFQEAGIRRVTFTFVPGEG